MRELVPASKVLNFQGLKLNVDWVPGRGQHGMLPALPGIYAEIHWPTRGVRIGETGRSIQSKISHDIRWFKAMQDGTAGPEQLRRTLPIAIAARKGGPAGFEFYVVSSDPRLGDKALRQNAERFMFAWVAHQSDFVDWNRQVSWH